MPYADKSKRYTHIKPLTCESVAATLQLLKDGRMRTVHEIASVLPYSVHTVQEAMKSLEFHKEAHLHHYASIPGGGTAAMWSVGSGERAPKPPKQTDEEFRAKQAKYRERYRMQRGPDKKVALQPNIFRHPHDVWLFGECVATQPTQWTGRVYKQSMDIDEWGQSRSAA
ncbi:hypothetical protein [Paraburkholderia unamae]|uniref:Helix-turn-helix protein n=1 Tax=Paraburkholderia unamae TaxID=219649 RepID=A0ABX5K6Y1_9BURK|nr:hypothetical protein [Paraburkholderia unamae]PVX61291.1 hypothetical protein C7402_1413 [Paraburkholderia unamae]